MLVLGVESTCDETAVALVADGRVRASVVASQNALHEVYRGVVPEIASRAHVEAFLPTLDEALKQANATLDDVEAVAVAHRPGLIGSLLVGLTGAKALAWARGVPLVGVDHVAAHLFSVTLADAPPTPEFPAVGLVCSGGHTALYALQSWTDVELVGRSVDDAVGEAYDKAAAILGLPYPGGPVVDRLAREGDARKVRFPRPMLAGDASLDFSFSGLKTSLLYRVRGHQGREREVALSEQELRDVCAGFQAACVDVLTAKLARAAERVGAKCAVVGGGVSANAGLRDGLAKLPFPCHVPPLAYCTDNAAMIAGLGEVLLRAGRADTLALDATTGSAIPMGAV